MDPVAEAPPSEPAHVISPVRAQSAESRVDVAFATVERAIATIRSRLLSRARIERTATFVSAFVGVAIVLATLRAVVPAFELRVATLPTLAALLFGAWLSGRAQRDKLTSLEVARTLRADELQ